MVLIVAALTSVSMGIGLARALAARHEGPDRASGSQHQAMLDVVHRLGRPAGFDALAPAWDGDRLNAYYQVHCTGTGGACPVDVPRVVADWAKGAGDPAFTLDYLRACPVAGCAGVYERDGWSVYTLLTTDATTGYPWYTLQVSVYAA